MGRSSYRVEIPGGNGYPLAGIVDQPLDAEPNERGLNTPVVIFSHCFTCNKDLKAIVRISRQLAAKGYLVLRYDMTGLGGSQGEFANTNFRTNLADLLAAARFATESIGPPTILLGHSLGGAASLAAAAEWPADLVQLSGVATLAAPSDTQHLAELLVRMDPQVEITGRGRVSIGGRHWETTSQLIADLRSFDLPARLSGIDIPLLAFHSPVDKTVGYDHALRLIGLVGSKAPASLIGLPGADHLLANDPRDLTFVGEMLAAWLTRLTS